MKSPKIQKAPAAMPPVTSSRMGRISSFATTRSGFVLTLGPGFEENDDAARAVVAAVRRMLAESFPTATLATTEAPRETTLTASVDDDDRAHYQPLIDQGRALFEASGWHG